MRFVTAHLTEAGGRDVNQDAWGARTAANGVHFWVLADGLGGHAGGEIAARLCVEQALAAFDDGPRVSGETLARCVESAHRAILERQAGSEELAQMRTTVVALAADRRHALWVHVGDSRLYHLRRGRIVAQTEDHSVPQLMVAAGDLRADEVRRHADRNRLLRSLGQPGEVRATVEPEPVPVQPGDAFLLCSDGFWELVYETEIEVDFAKADRPDDWLENMRERLQRRIAPGSDNFTAVAVFVEER